jgi:hypothetical protein
MQRKVSDENEDMTEIFLRYKQLTAEEIVYDTEDATELPPIEPCRDFDEDFYRMIRRKK